MLDVDLNFHNVHARAPHCISGDKVCAPRNHTDSVSEPSRVLAMERHEVGLRRRRLRHVVPPRAERGRRQRPHAEALHEGAELVAALLEAVEPGVVQRMQPGEDGVSSGRGLAPRSRQFRAT